MNRKMTDEEFQKLSIETEVSVYDLQYVQESRAFH